MANRGTFFDIAETQNIFNSSLLEEDDVELRAYLEGYKGLHKFCTNMGSVFGFVGTEIQSKSDVLIALRAADKNGNFSTLKRMVRHEMESGLLQNSGYVSGCRTLLRLHRGLDFLKTFLGRVAELSGGDATGWVAQQAYTDTLANYHPWYIRFSAHTALHFLPRKDDLLLQICGEIIDSRVMVHQMLQVVNQVYDRMEICFKNNNLLNLP